MLTNQKKITPSKQQRPSQFECAIKSAVASVMLFIRHHNCAAAQAKTPPQRPQLGAAAGSYRARAGGERTTAGASVRRKPKIGVVVLVGWGGGGVRCATTGRCCFQTCPLGPVSPFQCSLGTEERLFYKSRWELAVVRCGSMYVCVLRGGVDHKTERNQNKTVFSQLNCIN